MNREHPIQTRLFYAAIVGSSVLSVSIALLYRETIPHIPFIVLTALVIGYLTKEKLFFTGITGMQAFLMGMAFQDAQWGMRCMVFFILYMTMGMYAGVLLKKAKAYHDGVWSLHQKKHPIRIVLCVLLALFLLIGGAYSYTLYLSVL